VSSPPTLPKAALWTIGIVAGVGILYAVSHPTVRGAGKTATIDGKEYLLRGAFDSSEKASSEARRIRKQWRANHSRGSVRVLKKRFRGTATLYLVYTRSRWLG
jgi:hypothetical protein